MYGYPQPPQGYGAPPQPPQNQNQYPRMAQGGRDPYHQQPAYIPQEPQIIYRPVASFEEARSLPTDLNGALMIMPDFGHEMIYIKQLDPQTGQAPINSFKRIPNIQPPVPQDYTPILAAMEKRLKHLEDMWEVSPEHSGQEETKI